MHTTFDNSVMPPLAPSHGDEECTDGCAPDPRLVIQFRSALRALSGKWKVEILSALIDGPQRFGRLRRAVPGVSRHMLTEQLRELVRDGLVFRTAYAERVPRVEYELTDAGDGLLPVFRALRDWSDRYATAISIRD